MTALVLDIINFEQQTVSKNDLLPGGHCTGWSVVTSAGLRTRSVFAIGCVVMPKVDGPFCV